MELVYNKEEPPESFSKAIFLAGPTPRSPKIPSWRPETIEILEQYGYDGVVFVPEDRCPKFHGDSEEITPEYIEQVEWEEKCLKMADCIVFWVPRSKIMPALTTNIEWGAWANSGKVIFGAPSCAAKVRYLRYYARKLGVPNCVTLEGTIQAALDLIGNGALRVGGEREVPLHIWKTTHFQQWYLAQKNAGNRLDGAKVEWTFRVGPKKNFVFLWALHANVYVASEKRNKVNEVVIARPDIATIVMYRRRKPLDDSDIILIREFRSPAATDDGFVWEVPGGSSKAVKAPMEVVADECEEETGLRICTDRIRKHESRQLVATLSSHKAHLFSVEITSEELGYFHSQSGVAHGIAGDSERTYVEVIKLGDLRRQSNVDWSMLGMILSVLA